MSSLLLIGKVLLVCEDEEAAFEAGLSIGYLGYDYGLGLFRRSIMFLTMSEARITG